jgi:hypothetical protein
MNPMLIRLFVGLFTLFVFSGCGNANSSENPWEQTTRHFLEAGEVTIRLPHSFKPSSRYRIEEYFSSRTNVNPEALLLLQLSLESLEFTDSEPDIFVDTLSNFHLLTLINVDRTPFNQSTGNFLSSRVRQAYERMEARDPKLEVEKVQTQMKENGALQLLKFKHRLHNRQTGVTIFRTIYFATSSLQTYIIDEYSHQEEDIEKYIWSLER